MAPFTATPRLPTGLYTEPGIRGLLRPACHQQTWAAVPRACAAARAPAHGAPPCALPAGSCAWRALPCTIAAFIRMRTVDPPPQNPSAPSLARRVAPLLPLSHPHPPPALHICPSPPPPHAGRPHNPPTAQGPIARLRSARLPPMALGPAAARQIFLTAPRRRSRTLESPCGARLFARVMHALRAPMRPAPAPPCLFIYSVLLSPLSTPLSPRLCQPLRPAQAHASVFNAAFVPLRLT